MSTDVCTHTHTYLDVVSVVVGPEVDVGGPRGGDDGQPLRQVARPQHGVQEVVPPAVPLQKAAQPLVPAANKQRKRREAAGSGGGRDGIEDKECLIICIRKSQVYFGSPCLSASHISKIPVYLGSSCLSASHISKKPGLFRIPLS